jgi:hypothetical protein
VRPCRCPPSSEHRKLEQELAELRGQIAAHKNELAIRAVKKARRERLDWQIRRTQKRMAEVERRLAGS